MRSGSLSLVNGGSGPRRALRYKSGALPASTVFAHGVASGDPLTDRVMIWTQVGTGEGSVPVSWAVARDPGLSDAVASGETTAEAEHDHTVHVDVTGLEPGVTYHYGFSAEGEDSPVGRTWTLRADAVPVAAISVLQFLWGDL